MAVALLVAVTALSIATAPSVRIGNFLVTAPNGIAAIYDDREAFVVDFGGDYVAGIAAPDDSYHSQDLTLPGGQVRLEWGRTGDTFIGRLTSDKSCDVDFRVREDIWPGFFKGTTSDSRSITMLGSDAGQPPLAVLRFDREIEATGADHFRIKLEGSQPAFFSTQPGAKLVPRALSRQLDSAREKYLGRRPTASGAWGDFVGAIADNMNNSRLYASDEKGVAHSVSRGWAGGNPNNAPFFCWDSFFNGALACLDDPATARDTVRTILSWQTPEGLVPNFGHWQFDKSRASDDRSQPPVGSLCVWKMQMRRPDMNFLREVYPKLLKWHHWWPKNRDGDHDGLLEWGSSAAGKQGALWETGWDDTPEYADSEMSGFTLDTDAVDLNSLYAMDAEYLAHIADAVGDHATARALREERAETIKRINERLWNPELGLYCSRKWDSKGGAFLTRITPMNFYPLIAGAPSPERAQTVLKALTDPKRFWGKWLLPTVPYDDPLWPHQSYWHGTVWAPVNFLMFQGLHRYAPAATQAEFAARSVDLFMRNWTAKGWCGENFGSDNGLVNGDKHYTWGALMCLVGLESICAIEPDGSVSLNGAQSEAISIKNVPIHGRLYSVETGPGWASLTYRGSAIFTARGKIENRRL